MAAAGSLVVKMSAHLGKVVFNNLHRNMAQTRPTQAMVDVVVQTVGTSVPTHPPLSKNPHLIHNKGLRPTQQAPASAPNVKLEQVEPLNVPRRT